METLQLSSALCAACLTDDRKTFPLENEKAFLQLMGNDYASKCPKQISICWECTALIKKFLKFQEKVKKAQMLLQLPENTVSSLSNLVKTESTIINITPYDQETDQKKTHIHQPVPVIKKEEEDFVDFDEEDDSSQLYEQQEIKLEDTDVKIEENDNIVPRSRYSNRAEITKNLAINWDDPTSHFTVSILSDQEIILKGNCYMKVKKKKKDQYCNLCKKTFITKFDAKQHETFVHVLNDQSGGPLQCLECKEECLDVDSLRAHWTTHNLVLRCNYCQEAVSSYTSTLKQHLSKHMLCFTCKECIDLEKKIYFSFQDFSHHFKTLHLRYICDLCQKKSKTRAALVKHIRSRHIQPQCSACGKTYRRYLNLQCHIDSVHPELNRRKKLELSYCVECNKQFGNAILYKKHLLTTKVHNPLFIEKRRKVSVPCPHCERVFTRTTYMRNHLRQVHTKQSKHRCVMCNKILFSAWSLKQHISGVHMKIRPPKDKICDYCGYAFSTNPELTKHRRTHTGERPYRCTHCPAAFTQITPLKSHLKTQHKVF